MPAAPANQAPINFAAINVQPQGQPFQSTPKTAIGQTPNLLQAPPGQPSGLPLPADARTKILTAVQKMTADGVAPAQIQSVVDFAKQKYAPTPIGAVPQNTSAGTNINPLNVASAQMSIGNVIRQVSQQFQGGATQAASSLKDLITGNQPAINPQNLQDTYRGGGLPAALAEGGAQALKAGEQGAAQLGSAVGGIGAAVTAPLAPLFNAGTKIGQNIGNAVPTPIAKGIATASSNPTVNENVKDIMNLSNLAAPDAADKGLSVTKDVGTKVGEAAQATKEALTPDFSGITGAKDALANKLQESTLKLTPTQKSTLGPKLAEVKDYLSRNNVTGNPVQRFDKITEIWNNKENSIQEALKGSNVTASRQVITDALESLKQNFQNDRDVNSIEKQIDDAISVVKRQPEQVPVTNLNELKRSTMKQAFNTAGTKVRDDVEFAIGDALKDSESKALDAAGVKIEGKSFTDFNKEYSTVINARKILKMAQGKSQLGLTGNLASRFVASLVGSAIGGVPGEVIGALAGPKIGEAVAGTAAKSKVASLLRGTSENGNQQTNSNGPQNHATNLSQDKDKSIHSYSYNGQQQKNKTAIVANKNNILQSGPNAKLLPDLSRMPQTTKDVLNNVLTHYPFTGEASNIATKRDMIKFAQLPQGVAGQTEIPSFNTGDNSPNTPIELAFQQPETKLTHELFNSFFNRSSINPADFNKAWLQAAKSNPDMSGLENILHDPDNNAAFHSNGEEVATNPYDLASERFALMGSLWGNDGLKSLPKELQSYYKAYLK